MSFDEQPDPLSDCMEAFDKMKVRAEQAADDHQDTLKQCEKYSFALAEKDRLLGMALEALENIRQECYGPRQMSKILDLAVSALPAQP